MHCTYALYQLVSGGFLKKFRRGKGAQFAKCFRRNKCIRQTLGNNCRFHVFFKRKSAQENRESRKKGFSYKRILYLAIGQLLLPRICRPLITATATGVEIILRAIIRTQKLVLGEDICNSKTFTSEFQTRPLMICFPRIRE